MFDVSLISDQLEPDINEMNLVENNVLVGVTESMLQLNKLDYEMKMNLFQIMKTIKAYCKNACDEVHGNATACYFQMTNPKIVK